MRMYQYTTTCILCPTKIKPSHVLCKPCYKLYSDQMNEDWFKEIMNIQRRQDYIDKRENKGLPYYTQTDMYGVIQTKGLDHKKNVGKPKTQWNIIERVLDIFDTSIENNIPVSLRSIANVVKDAGYTIHYTTVRNILLEFRKKQYKQYMTKP